MKNVLTKSHVIVFTALSVFIIVGTKFYKERDTYMKLYRKQARSSQEVLDIIRRDNSDIDMEELIQQRNNLSRQLNIKQQKIGKYECEGNITVSSRGGWCSNLSKQYGGLHMTDTELVPVLAEFLKVAAELIYCKYVAAFDDGPGRYKQLLLETGLLKAYEAYDGAPFSEQTSEGRVKFLDLTLMQYGLPLYDWVMRLEVAEHIPQQYEKIYIDNVVRHAKEGVILSWAVPGQDCHSHVNMRSFQYVKTLFDKLGFVHDADSSDKLKNVSTLPWLKTNTNVYRRRDISRIEQMKHFI